MTVQLHQPYVAPAVRHRRPSAVAALTAVTLGIYSWFWYLKVNREMRDFGRFYREARLAQSRPVLSVLAVTLGALAIFPPVVSLVRATGRLRACERVAYGRAQSCGVLLSLIAIWIAAGVATGLVTGTTALIVLTGACFGAYVAFVAGMQRRLNRVWRALPDAPPSGGAPS